jgi:hypothetical protein
LRRAQPHNFYPATLVNFNGLARTTEHLLHFDDGICWRSVWGLPDDGIKIVTTTVKECPCRKCADAKLTRPWKAKP